MSLLTAALPGAAAAGDLGHRPPQAATARPILSVIIGLLAVVRKTGPVSPA